MVVQEVDGHPVRLRRPHDLGFLSRWGRVFVVLDRQDSGNLCFGLDGPAGRVFVKYAGAETVRHNGAPSDAVRRNCSAAEVYRSLQHPTLTRLQWAGEVGAGHVLVFDWVDAVPMGRMYGQSHRVRELSPRQRVEAVQQILDFHVHAVALGWVAVDLYDGSVLLSLPAGR